MKPKAVNTEKCKGKVLRLIGDYGFIGLEDGREVYFKPAWFRGHPPPVEGTTLAFDIKDMGEKFIADNISRGATPAQLATSAKLLKSAVPLLIYEWTYFERDTLPRLAAMALPERWEFKDSPPDPERPCPILRSYLEHTFGRLARENKVLVNEGASLAAFNTGLVDHRYEPIHAIFTPSDAPPRPWQFASFCIAGEGPAGQELVRHFAELPQPAHYFDDPMDLLYDTRGGEPKLDWEHIVIERISRYPKEFVEDHWPPGIPQLDTSKMTHGERQDYYVAVGDAIRKDSRTYRSIMSRVKDAIDLSIKRVTWNYKTVSRHITLESNARSS